MENKSIVQNFDHAFADSLHLDCFFIKQDPCVRADFRPIDPVQQSGFVSQGSIRYIASNTVRTFGLPASGLDRIVIEIVLDRLPLCELEIGWQRRTQLRPHGSKGPARRTEQIPVIRTVEAARPINVENL